MQGIQSAHSIIALACAMSAPALAADSVKTDPNPAKPCRALDESVKTTGGDSGKAGRRIDDTDTKNPDVAIPR